MEVGTKVAIRIARCACVGGGFTEENGVIIGIIQGKNGLWYQVNHPNGVATVKEDQIIRINE